MSVGQDAMAAGICLWSVDQDFVDLDSFPRRVQLLAHDYLWGASILLGPGPEGDAVALALSIAMSDAAGDLTALPARAA